MKKLLFVCTGNTCRSPMAAALWRHMGGEAASAGLSAPSGAPASDHAVKVMAWEGIDLTAHRSSPVTEEVLRRADLVYGMTEGHAAQLRMFFPAYADRVRVMPVEVPDPYGGSLEDYRAAALRIREALEIIARGEGFPGFTRAQSL